MAAYNPIPVVWNVFEQEYKFSIQTRQIRVTQSYAECEYKQARLFLKGIHDLTALTLKSAARIFGRQEYNVASYRLGEYATREGDTKTTDCITAYVPINNIHWGEWITYLIRGIVDAEIKYSGIEVGAIPRRENSNVVYAQDELTKSAMVW